MLAQGPYAEQVNIVKEVVPEMYCFCYLTYCYHSTLQFNSFSIFSQVGGRSFVLFSALEAVQVDPFNILLWLHGWHHAMGNVHDVSQDVEFLKSKVEAIGLVLHAAKCEVISKSNASNLTLSGMFKDFIALTIEDCTLGVSLSRSSNLDSGLAYKIAKLRSVSVVSPSCLRRNC